MSQWDPNDPNNPYNQQWQQQQGQWQQPQQPQQQQQPPQQQQWDQQAQQQQWQQQQQQPQQQWDQQAQQQQQWDQQAQQQQQWDQQAQQQQQYDQYGQQQPQQPYDQQQQYAQQQQYDQYGQQQQQQYGAQPQQDQQQGGGFGGGGFGFGGGQQPAYGQQAYQGAYNETFGNASDAVPGVIATLGVNERVQFLRRTYLHLAGAIAVFVGLLYVFMVPLQQQAFELTEWMLFPRWKWLIVLAAFGGVSFVADQWAQRASSKPMQYLGLGLYVLAEAIIFVPLLTIVLIVSNQPGAILGISAIITLALFTGLTLTVFITKKDFSFLRGALGLATMAALGIIVCGIIFGFNLGIFFAGAMLLLASGYVLFYTSRVMKYYHPNQYVAASLALFACIALILWYVIQIVMSLASD
jgi:hypothetical protein